MRSLVFVISATFLFVTELSAHGFPPSSNDGILCPSTKQSSKYVWSLRKGRGFDRSSWNTRHTLLHRISLLFPHWRRDCGAEVTGVKSENNFSVPNNNTKWIIKFNFGWKKQFQFHHCWHLEFRSNHQKVFIKGKIWPLSLSAILKRRHVLSNDNILLI